MTAKAVIGVYWGRFNPPHRGHLRMVQRLRKRCTLTVAIGSAERRDERANPFSGAERKAMMEGYLKEAGIRDVRVITLTDGPSVSWSIDNLVRTCQPDILFLSTEHGRLASLTGRRVRVVRFRRVGRVSSSRIRESIAGGRMDWKRLTGDSVATWILTHHGIARIQRAYRVPNR